MAAASTMPMTMGNERGDSRFGSASRSSMSCSGLRSWMRILESSIWTSMGDCRGVGLKRNAEDTEFAQRRREDEIGIRGAHTGLDILNLIS